MDLGLKGGVALVTAGGRGLVLAVAQELAEKARGSFYPQKMQKASPK